MLLFSHNVPAELGVVWIAHTMLVIHSFIHSLIIKYLAGVQLILIFILIYLRVQGTAGG